VVDWGGGVQCPLARAVDRPHSAAAPLAIANQLPLREIVKRDVLVLPCKPHYIRIRPLPLQNESQSATCVQLRSNPN